MTDGNANVQSDVNALKKYGFDKQFDGIPRIHFELYVWKPFLNAIGQISVDGTTLLDTYNDIDPGAQNGPIVAPGLPLGIYRGVAQIHANPAQVRQHADRERRLYAVALSHTVIGSFYILPSRAIMQTVGVLLACTFVSSIIWR